MKIETDKVVLLEYELTVNGDVVDKATEEQPLDYIHGNNMLLPKFENELDGKEPGDSFEFSLEPEDGYGEYEENRKFDIPKSSFEIDGKIREDLLTLGRYIPLMNSSGNVVQGKVHAVNEDSVTMDFNHPMAGKTLNFKGRIVSVRDATEKELTEGLHGEFLPYEGCGCGHDHGDGECCGHHHGHDHGDGECCGHHHGHDHGDSECCGHHHGHDHGDGECCGKHKEDSAQAAE